ncbi:MAG: hypothetical protein GY820_45660 [Gammaproteobacteria bacterium]|nr:hypothetical protein [Gammaproteobacteria bacterium]
MADSPQTQLRFEGRCPDCGTREVRLPSALPELGDDFDWQVRDYDGFRTFMLEELSARFPERTRWTAADLEVVLVEVLATVLDQLSDMLDRVAAETFLETARRPQTVRQLLAFIGYDVVAAGKAKDQIAGNLEDDEAVKALDDYWRSHPHAMEQAKRIGPREIHTQKRMVTTEDYASRLREHPLVIDAHAWSEWTGSWYTLSLAVIVWEAYALDDEISYPDEVKVAVENFHETLGLVAPNLDDAPLPTARVILWRYIDALRMVGQEVLLQDPVYIGIYFSLSVRVASNFYQSEMRHAIAQVLGHGATGFFEPGRHGFGEDLYSSDVIEALMALDGIEQVCLNRFKRIGSQYADRAQEGFIPLHGMEVAICNNNAAAPSNGYYRLKLQGGRKG